LSTNDRCFQTLEILIIKLFDLPICDMTDAEKIFLIKNENLHIMLFHFQDLEIFINNQSNPLTNQIIQYKKMSSDWTDVLCLGYGKK